MHTKLFRIKKMKNVFFNLTRAFKNLRNRRRQCHQFGDGVNIDPIANALKNFPMAIICK